MCMHAQPHINYTHHPDTFSQSVKIPPVACAPHSMMCPAKLQGGGLITPSLKDMITPARSQLIKVSILPAKLDKQKHNDLSATN